MTKISLHMDSGKRADPICSAVCPRSSSRQRNTTGSVTVVTNLLHANISESPTVVRVQ